MEKELHNLPMDKNEEEREDFLNNSYSKTQSHHNQHTVSRHKGEDQIQSADDVLRIIGIMSSNLKLISGITNMILLSQQSTQTN